MYEYIYKYICVYIYEYIYEHIFEYVYEHIFEYVYEHIFEYVYGGNALLAVNDAISIPKAENSVISIQELQMVTITNKLVQGGIVINLFLPPGGGNPTTLG